MKTSQNKRIDEIEDQIETLEDQLTKVRKVPKVYDVFLSIIGTAAWLYVGIRWHDRALIVLNTILLALLVSGGARYIVQWYM